MSVVLRLYTSRNKLLCLRRWDNNGRGMGMYFFNKFKTSLLTASIWSPMANCNRLRLVWPWESSSMKQRNPSCPIKRFMTLSLFVYASQAQVVLPEICPPLLHLPHVPDLCLSNNFSSRDGFCCKPD